MFQRFWDWLKGAHLTIADKAKVAVNSEPKKGSKVDESIGLSGILAGQAAQHDARIGASRGSGTRTEWAMRAAHKAPAPDRDITS